MDKLTNFRKTLNELKSYVAIPILTNRDRAGVIQAFEFTYEQAWKALQKFASESGSEVGSPKSAFIFALQNKWIKESEEAKWLKLLKDRNLTTHTYQEEIAEEVLQRINSDYLRMFQELLDILETL
jgi:nucleotidyltransferase substrate binding protein (TIGR01987 family)